MVRRVTRLARLNAKYAPTAIILGAVELRKDFLTAQRLTELLGRTCKSCRSDVRKDLTKLRECLKSDKIPGHSELTETQAAAPHKSAPSENSGGSQQFNYAEVVKIINRTVKDTNNRKCNAIISGLREIDGVDDGENFSMFCEEHLSIKPRVRYNGTRRLGKTVRDKPRRLLVRLECEAAAADLFSSAYSLRQSSDSYIASNVYFNPDLTKDEAKVAFERRQERRQRNAGTGNVPTSIPTTTTIRYSVFVNKTCRNNRSTGQSATRNPSNLISCSADQISSTAQTSFNRSSDLHVIGATVAPPNTGSILNPCANVYLPSDDVATSYTAAPNVASTSAAEPMA